MSELHPYSGREQTQVKHFILSRYLERLAFKILSISELTYVDAFSGPWETKTQGFADSSFMNAIQVLMKAQTGIHQQFGACPRIRCFFSEENPESYLQLRTAVAPYHKPDDGFEIRTFCGRFEDAITEIKEYVGNSFLLLFIDPTGWTGYSFEKITPLLKPRKCEVLINFMYAFISRFAHSDDEAIVNSLNPILGGPGWRARLDPSKPRGEAVEQLFRESLKSTGNFRFVISTRIDKATADFPHFYLTYGTKSADGLKAFRETEYAALRAQARARADAKERRREARSGTSDLFAGHQAKVQEAAIDELVRQNKILAESALLNALAGRVSMSFSDVVTFLLQDFVLRETDVKNICVDLAKRGKITNTWGKGNRKPNENTTISLLK
jgi:three-Cys-motif partner protein